MATPQCGSEGHLAQSCAKLMFAGNTNIALAVLSNHPRGKRLCLWTLKAKLCMIYLWTIIPLLLLCIQIV